VSNRDPYSDRARKGPALTGVGVEKLFSAKFAKMKLRQDAL